MTIGSYLLTVGVLVLGLVLIAFIVIRHVYWREYSQRRYWRMVREIMEENGFKEYRR